MRADLLPDWSALAVSPAGARPAAELFQTREWQELLAREGFVEPVAPLLLHVSPAGHGPALVLPLVAAGAGLQSLSNYYCSLFGPLGPDLDAKAWSAIGAWLRRHPRGGVLDLKPLDAAAGWVVALGHALQAQGYRVDRYFCFGNWYQPVGPGGFEAYFGARPSALRHSVERGRRRLQRTGTHALEIHAAAGPALDGAIADFAAVYARSWKQPEPTPRFMPALMRLAAAQGWLRLGVLRIDGEAVAAQLWLVHAGKANIYKLAYVQGYERFSPGSVLTAALMQHVIDVDQVREVDYLSGDDAYKKDWMGHRRERIGLVAFHPLRWRGLLAGLRHFGGKAWRRWRAPSAPASA